MDAVIRALVLRPAVVRVRERGLHLALRAGDRALGAAHAAGALRGRAALGRRVGMGKGRGRGRGRGRKTAAIEPGARTAAEEGGSGRRWGHAAVLEGLRRCEQRAGGPVRVLLRAVEQEGGESGGRSSVPPADAKG